MKWFKIFSALLFVYLLVINFAFGLDKNKISQTETFNCQKVQEYKLTEQNIKTVMLSNKTMTSTGYPKLIVTQKILTDGRQVDDRLIIYDNNRNEIFSIELYSQNRWVTEISEHGNYFIIHNIKKEWTKEKKGLSEFVLINETGKNLWTKQKIMVYDGNSFAYDISSKDGSVVEIDNMGGILKFYDPTGKLVKEVKIFEKYIWGYKRGINGKFSDDGKYFVASVTDGEGVTFSNNTATILFNNQGSEIWRFEMDEGSTFHHLNISPNNNYFISTTSYKGQSATYLFDIDGNLITKYNKHTVRSIFSSDEIYCGLIYHGLTTIINLENGNILSKVGPRGGGIKSIDIFFDKQLVGMITAISIGRTAHRPAKSTNLTAKIRSFNRKMIWSQTYEDLIEYTSTGCQFSEDGKEFVVMVGAKVYKYKLE
jgi:WD40 repeat protein